MLTIIFNLPLSGTVIKKNKLKFIFNITHCNIAIGHNTQITTKCNKKKNMTNK